ncbi:Barrier-to-autointegration factor A [Amphibalanus amphitrite]|uniref:Barrier-to-autointegration factor A n=1 Tax=Amphibalanus amphitrite TaxID=1232801 RepID=A0A6A4VN62_AMPAM|nr:Barrier-to-autointegration factor A [Amphibalanus amphitrite]
MVNTIKKRPQDVFDDAEAPQLRGGAHGRQAGHCSGWHRRSQRQKAGGERFDKVYIVLGQFLVLKKDKELFVEWLQDLIGCNVKQATDCWQCLDGWCAELL